MSDQSITGGLEAARGWWQRNCSMEKGSPEVRARLRRCRSRVEAAMIPQALALGKTLVPDAGADVGGWKFGAALDLARVLAHVRADTREAPMRHVGWKSFPTGAEGAERPELSELRFRRLLQATDGEERVDAFIRLIALMNGTANVGEIARAFRAWSHPDGHAQQRWAYTYYNAADYTPDTDAEHPNQETVAS